KFCCNIMISQVNTIVIWGNDFSFVRKPALPFLFQKPEFSGYRHNGKLAVIIHPWRWLVSLFETFDLISVIGIGPAIAHFSGLRGPEIHAPGPCYGGICIAV